jgi:hypothetical protein
MTSDLLDFGLTKEGILFERLAYIIYNRLNSLPKWADELN